MDAFSYIPFISGLHLAVAVTPGPSTLAICCVASAGSRFEGLSVAAGVVTATALWVSAALMGTGAMIASHTQIVAVFRSAAAVYLLWTGFRMLAVPAVSRPAARPGQPFLMGLLTSLGNPLSIAFWLGAFLAAVPEDASNTVYVAIFSVIILQSVVWYFLLAMLFSSGLRIGFPGAARIARFVAAGVMIAVGLNILILA